MAGKNYVLRQELEVVTVEVLYKKDYLRRIVAVESIWDKDGATIV